MSADARVTAAAATALVMRDDDASGHHSLGSSAPSATGGVSSAARDASSELVDPHAFARAARPGGGEGDELLGSLAAAYETPRGEAAARNILQQVFSAGKSPQ